MFASKHHPDGSSTHHLDNTRLESLLCDYRSTGDPESLGTILSLAQERALTLIRFHKSSRFCSEAELMSDVNCKLIRAVPRFDPTKGSAFTFLSCVIQNSLHTSVATARRDSARYTELDENIAGSLQTNGETHSREAIDDLSHHLKSQVKMTLSDPRELDAARWFVDSFLDGAFELPRHQCADACMVVHQLNHSRSRELYDLVLLECRRVVYDELPPRQPIAPGRLYGRREAWMARFASLMNPEEFTKFFTLVRGLSPFVIILVHPQNHSRRGDRSPAVTRSNIEFTLNGHPAAVPLF
jgi:hypothetical protein